MNLVAQPTTPQPVLRPRSRIGLAVAALFVVFPAVPFYIVLFRTALDIPFCDDYGGIEWVIHLEGLSGSAAKLSFLFESQVNEYKLVFAEAVVWLQVALMGHIDFKLLSAVSNAFVLLIALLLWKMFLPARKDLGLRLALFIPVTWLLFQFEYQELLNWGGVGLQHLPSLLSHLRQSTFCLARREGHSGAPWLSMSSRSPHQPTDFYCFPLVCWFWSLAAVTPESHFGWQLLPDA